LSARPASHPSHQGGQEASRRQGLRQRGVAAMAERSRHQSRHSQQVQPQTAVQLRQEILQATTPYRERLLSAQGLPPYRNSLRQTGAKLSRLSLPRRCYRMVDLMSLDPSPWATVCRSFPRVLYRRWITGAAGCGLANRRRVGVRKRFVSPARASAERYARDNRKRAVSRPRPKPSKRPSDLRPSNHARACPTRSSS
jgi:hypothetical protein